MSRVRLRARTLAPAIRAGSVQVRGAATRSTTTPAINDRITIAVRSAIVAREVNHRVEILRAVRVVHDQEAGISKTIEQV